ncbi:hypothetical protein FLK61_34230 [Paenalkalicoccus suaedae]|uniref:Uncharacterized protein n=1 Tax=Paenalkalicoccus suaedae TaxID=2592382 RepID=A0A859FF61_9BACI|nr:hypothetical protein [Paenalkalicoccus suaedae]QKS71683.1 hypothetical protein FLK61_33935 [Paenalkalicoccus suaedae]QKS71737.1 hypothetical protein FLK61_34230 [Paenalkalicoccus suaedae]
MNFAHDLRTARDTFLQEQAREVVEQKQMELIFTAKKGFTQQKFTISEDLEYMRSQDFANIVETFLDGVKVRYEVREEEIGAFFRITKPQHYLVFDWSEEDKS